MKKSDNLDDKIIIYTDASYDNEFKIATYGIVVEKNDKIVKQYAKKIQCIINNSTEAEIYGIYQAMNLINCCYFNKNIKQTIRIKTDCTWAKKFFTTNEYDDMFLHDKKLYDEMKNLHINLKKRVQRANNSFKIKWLSRELNIDSHKISKRQLNLYRKEYLGFSEEVSFKRNILLKLLTNFSEGDRKVFAYLLENANEKGVLKLTQSEVSKSLGLSLSRVNRTFKKFEELFLMAKRGRRDYKLLIIK